MSRAEKIIIVSNEDLERYKYENRCVFCKKQTFEDKVKCEKCLEFEYCSVECLENNREGHQNQCNIICFKKGVRIVVERSYIEQIHGRSKLLGREDDIKNEIEAMLEVATVNSKGRHQTMSQSNYQKGNKNKKKKKNKRKGEGMKAAPSVSVPVTFANTGNQRDVCTVSSILSLIRHGKFGGPVRCTEKHLSGTSFGHGWWKAGGLTKSHVKDSKFTEPTRLRFADFYSDSDEEDSNEEVDASIACQKDKSIKSHDNGKNSSQFAKTETVNFRPEAIGKLTLVFQESAHNSMTGNNEVRGAINGRLTLDKCSFCGRQGVELQTCSRCKKSKYCNRSCQFKHFSRHKDHCRETRHVPKQLSATNYWK